MTRKNATVSLFVSIVIGAAGIAGGGVIGHWSFDTDFTDSSSSNNDLTVGVGPATITTTAGEHAFGGGALDLDSTTSNQRYLDLTNPITFGATDAWSVAFWARHRPGNDGRTGMIIGDRTSTDFIWIPRDGAVDGLRYRNTSNNNADYVTPPAGVEAAGVYHHFAVIADGTGNVEVFYDNASLGSTSIATTFKITSVGQAFNQNTQSMNGQIDELYIFDEAIDSDVVNSLFANNQVPEPSGLLLGATAAVCGLVIRRRQR
jgi:hypothetical protein